MKSALDTAKATWAGVSRTRAEPAGAPVRPIETLGHSLHSKSRLPDDPRAMKTDSETRGYQQYELLRRADGSPSSPASPAPSTGEADWVAEKQPGALNPSGPSASPANPALIALQKGRASSSNGFIKTNLVNKMGQPLLWLGLTLARHQAVWVSP